MWRDHYKKLHKNREQTNEKEEEVREETKVKT